MRQEQFKNSGILVLSNLTVNLSNFLKQVIMAYFLGLSGLIDILLLAQIVPAIFQAMIGGGAGEILVIKRDKEGYSKGSFELVFIIFCLIPVIILCLVYWSSLGLIIPFFDSPPYSDTLFREISFIFLLNTIPGTFTSILRPHLYSKGLYSFYAVSTIVSQAVGIVFILIFLKSLGITAFAWGTLIANVINSFWFSFRAGLPLSRIFNFGMWKHEISLLTKLMKRVFSLSLQTFINYFGTFWERSLSVKYLAGGYLSSLNYSKTLSELPNAVLLSSVLTTSYIEQVKLHKISMKDFSEYTSRTLRFLIRAGFLFQIIMLVMAPFIIILIFRRGKFDNNAVESTLVIFNILTISFILKLLMNYFSRTMYILGEYRKLLLAIFVKFLIQVAIMAGLISAIRQAIPLAIVLGHLFVSIFLFLCVSKKTGLPSPGFFLGRLILISIVSVILLFIHVYTLHYYIDKSNLEILFFSLPPAIVSFIVLIIFMKRNGLEISALKKIEKLWGSIIK